MFFKTLVVGSLGVNCYILSDSDRAVCIDPGDNSSDIINDLKSNNLSLEAIINTHGHYDHIGANKDLTKEYNCPVYIHEDEIETLKDSTESLAFWSGEVPQINYHIYPLEDKEILELAGLEFEVFHTPGHSPGGVCLLQNGNLFTGDTIFKNSIGRTDFPGSDPAKMEQSLSFLVQMDKSLKVFPGHGESSTLDDELRNNPYLTGTFS